MSTKYSLLGDIDAVWSDDIDPTLTAFDLPKGSWFFYQNGGLPHWFIKTDDGLTTNYSTVMARSTANGTAAPTVSDDVTRGYQPQSRWTDTVGVNEYTCISSAVGAAVWKITT